MISAEFVYGDSGIGRLIWNSWQVLNIPRMFVGLFVILLFVAAAAWAGDFAGRKLMSAKAEAARCRRLRHHLTHLCRRGGVRRGIRTMPRPSDSAYPLNPFRSVERRLSVMGHQRQADETACAARTSAQHA